MAIPDKGRPDESKLVAEECRAIVTRIRANFGDACVEYIDLGEAAHAQLQWTVNNRLCAAPTPAAEAPTSSRLDGR